MRLQMRCRTCTEAVPGQLNTSEYVARTHIECACPASYGAFAYVYSLWPACTSKPSYQHKTGHLLVPYVLKRGLHQPEDMAVCIHDAVRIHRALTESRQSH